MLLAAGLGTRMRPLTYKVPKPLLPLDGMTVIDHQLKYLSHFGIEQVMINLHHLGDMIKEHVGDGSRYGIEIHFSEERTLLGTGGGIKKAEPFFGGDPFVVLNTDALMDIEISFVIENHMSLGSVATMVVRHLSAGDSYTPLSLHEDRISEFGKGDHFFAGLQIIDHRMLDLLPSAGFASCLINDGYGQFLKKGIPISAYVDKGPWYDLGNPDGYERAKKDIRDGIFKLSA